jgi:hypothetical protein
MLFVLLSWEASIAGADRDRAPGFRIRATEVDCEGLRVVLRGHFDRPSQVSVRLDLGSPDGPVVLPLVGTPTEHTLAAELPDAACEFAGTFRLSVGWRAHRGRHRPEKEIEEQLYDVLDLALGTVGPQGDQGPKGDKGDKGDPGEVAGTLAGEVTGPLAATIVTAAVPANIGNLIVRRDASGGFAAGTVALAGNLDLQDTTSASIGVITKGGVPFLHAFGSSNLFVGASAGNLTLTGSGNTGAGAGALHSHTAGHFNSALGSGALGSNTAGGYNSAFGGGALFFNTDGVYNSAFGMQAVYSNTTGNLNAGFGGFALFSNTTGFYNSGFGDSVLYSNTTGHSNAAFGLSALSSATTGESNSAFGYRALAALADGNFNVAIGNRAGEALVTGSDNIYVGSPGENSESGVIRIGSDSQSATYVAGISAQTSPSGVAVFVDSAGKLGTITSSQRYKEDIASMGRESDVLMRLRPVSFYYRPAYDETRTRQYGLVAEEVAEVAPQLVISDEQGRPQTVRYHFVNAMLLNEVQKQRHLADEQRSRIEDLEARLARLEAALATNP